MPGTHRFLAASLAMVVCCAVAPLMGGCVPAGSAVGDTRTESTNVTHDGVDKADITVGVLSAGDTVLDRRIIGACRDEGLRAVYASVGSDESPADSAGVNMQGLTSRVVNVVVVPGLQAFGHGGSSKEAVLWESALEDAREAGIPVVLVDNSGHPLKRTLTAVSLHVVEGPSDAVTTLEDALALVINDNPHPRSMEVSLGTNGK